MGQVKQHGAQQDDQSLLLLGVRQYQEFLTQSLKTDAASESDTILHNS
jgi:hypothetical protein